MASEVDGTSKGHFVLLFVEPALEAVFIHHTLLSRYRYGFLGLNAQPSQLDYVFCIGVGRICRASKVSHFQRFLHRGGLKRLAALASLYVLLRRWSLLVRLESKLVGFKVVGCRSANLDLL